jgi:crotonobetainyl-CoA:carnitine CoA-transferase CaiB-like acyl-CoA transferase
LQRPLEGIRVLSVTGALFGPYCGMLLADLGAEVIKVERPVYGDMNREWGPFFPNVQGPDKSGYFVSIHRNHKGITLNLKNPKAKEILKELVKKSDVLIENFKPGTLDEWGIGYEELKKVKSTPDIRLRVRIRSLRSLQSMAELRHHRSGYGWLHGSKWMA